MNVNPTAFRRLVREIKQLQTEPPEGIRISTDEENILDVTGIIQGPAGTPYEGGYFKVKFKFTEEFPAAPPKCWFTTKIFHPNVNNSSKEICVNTLKKDWKKEYGIAHILVTIKCLLIYPNPESALDEAAGKLLLENYEDYCRHAKLMTSVHATPKTRPPEFDIPSVISDSKPAAASAGPSTTPAPGSNTSRLATPAPPTSTAARGTSPAPNPPSTRHSTPAPTPLLSINATNSGSPPPTTAKPSSKSSGTTPHTSQIQLPGSQNVDPAGNMMDTSGADVKSPTASATAAKAGQNLKRSGAATAGGAEKRKKGLKRL